MVTYSLSGSDLSHEMTAGADTPANPHDCDQQGATCLAFGPQDSGMFAAAFALLDKYSELGRLTLKYFKSFESFYLLMKLRFLKNLIYR